MNLLIITQKVDINDDNLGFFHGWIEKFAEKAEKVYVICLTRGTYNLPKNVIVYSLGKENGTSKISQLIRLQKHLIYLLPKVDSVFVHMCPIYAVASFPLVKIFRKKMILWYLHKSVKWKLRLAEKCVDKILTASQESCRLKNRKKIEVVGHGIDVDLFKPQKSSSNVFRILSSGRIAPTKDQQTLIEAVDILANQKNIRDIEVKFIGSPLGENEEKYLGQLKNLVREKKLEDYIEFLGSVPSNEMPKHYQDADLVVNLSHTGSVDKVVLEAMASGCLVLTCNEAFQNILGKDYLFRKEEAQVLAEKIINLKGAGRDENLREIVVKHHNLENLIDKIITEFNVLN